MLRNGQIRPVRHRHRNGSQIELCRRQRNKEICVHGWFQFLYRVTYRLPHFRLATFFNSINEGVKESLISVLVTDFEGKTICSLPVQKVLQIHPVTELRGKEVAMADACTI